MSIFKSASIAEDTLIQLRSVTTIREKLGALVATAAIAAIFILVSIAPACWASIPWTQTDIGNTGASGTLNVSSGTYTIAGAGSGIAAAGTSDSFSFVSTPASGNIELVTKLTSQTNTSPYAVAGLMIRDSLSATGSGAVVGVSPQNGINFTYRLTDGSTSNTTLGPSTAAPVYLRLVLSGTSLAGYQSSDGISWNLVGKCTITLPTNYYIGFAVSSNVSGTLSTAVFNNVTLMTNVPQRGANMQLWLRSDVGVTYSSGNVSGWSDQSGNGNNAYQTVSGSQPTLATNAVNGLPAINFNGTSQTLSLNSAFSNFTAGATYFIVTKMTAATANASLINFGVSGSVGSSIGVYEYASTGEPMFSVINSAGTSQTYVAGTSAISTSQFQLLEAVQSSTTATLYVNGIQANQNTSMNSIPNTTRNSNLIGNFSSAYSDYYNGQIAEIIVYNAPMTSAQLISVQNYIYSKYGIGSTPTLAPPTFSINPGIYTTTQTVSISGPTGAQIFYTINGTPATVSSTPYTGPITVSNTTTINAITYSPGVTSGAASCPIEIDPTTNAIPRTNLNAWYRSDFGVGLASGSNISSWLDASGNGYAATQSSSSVQPTLTSDGINGLPALAFAGTSSSGQYLKIPSGFANFSNGLTIFLVTNPLSVTAFGARFLDFGPGSTTNSLGLQQTSSTGYEYYVNNAGTLGGITASSGMTLNQYQLIEATHNAGGTVGTVFTNGVQQNQGNLNVTIPNVTRTTNFIGQASAGGFYLNGLITEILVYNTILSTSQRIAVEAYLMQRYQIAAQAPTAPIFSVAAGTLGGPTQVAIAAQPGTTIYLTTNGTTPTTSSPAYTAPINVSYSQVVKAIAVNGAGVSSSVTSATYTLNANQWPAPASGGPTLQINLQLPTTAIPQ